MMIEATLRAQILDLFGTMKDSPMSEADYAGHLARIITNHVKTATVTVTVPPGIPVGTPVGPGATTAPMIATGNLS